MSRHLGFCARACAVVLALSGICQAQTGFGVDGNGNLFSFDVTAPGSIPITPIGNVGFVPEGIDFRPGTNTLYAIEIGAATTQLFTVDINTAAATPVGAGFNTIDAGLGYNLGGSQRFGFDFNPSTLQGDNSMRIRLVGQNGDNLRLNSSTGLINTVDTDLLIPPSSAPFVDGAAYLNNVPNAGTFATTLYDMDSRNDSLYTQFPPNNGTLNLVGAFFAGVGENANEGIGFDIFTLPGDADPSTTGDSAYAVLTRPTTQNGAYLLYEVSLGLGIISNGKLVGPVGSPSDFTGGLAIAPLPVPEPTGAVLLALGIAVCWALVARRIS